MRNYPSALPLWAGFVAAIAMAVELIGQTTSPAPSANLAAAAKPSASHVSDDTSLAALNDGHSPRNSRDNRRGSYGNWPRRGAQWVEYEWTQPIATNKVEIKLAGDVPPIIGMGMMASGIPLPAISR